MKRYVIVEEHPVHDRPETWAGKCEREHMETLAKIEGIELRAAAQPEPAKPAAPKPQPAQAAAPKGPVAVPAAAPAQPAAAPGADTEG